ncbi:single-stranded DNA-binding protein [Nocardioides dongxiaopingii]|uniref:single-stranded DNA-binding protein n=1 Tax=Nocardioides sp. S-1144 TaxID=2582905 RepID=UPI00110E6323|nr:single-stranded DNA-binding protein [Nocardioides sp. S-1144]QCW52303.1 single-stranded DNA-binding protein [Nocardioides sp. S-1144]
MAGETLITVVGNLTDDPELRFTPSGAAVANFTVASTPRTLNKQTNEWEDGEAMFLRCSIWRQAAENVAESLQKGARVIVQGRMRARTWETREGEKRTSFEIDVDEIGPSLRWATAKVARAGRSTAGGGGGGYSGGGGGAGGGAGGGGGYSGGGGGGQAEDPWASSAPQSGGRPAAGGGGGGAPANDPWGAPGVGSDEPPF